MLNKFKSFISLFNRAFGAYRIHMLVLTILGFLSGLLGGIGINTLIPIFSFIIDPEAVMTDPVSKFIRFIFISLGVDFSLKFLLIFVVLLFVAKAITLIIFSYITVNIIAGYEEKTRSALFRSAFKTKWAHLLKQRLGHLETILITNVQNSQNLFAQVSSAIMVSTSLIMYTAVAVSISFKLTLLTFMLGAVAFFFIKPLIKYLRNMAYEQEKINRDVAHHINENVLGMKTVKTFFVGEAVSETAEKYFRRIKSLKIRANVLNNMTSVFVEPVSVIFIALIFGLSYKTSIFSLAALATVVYLIKQIFQYINQFQTLIIGLNTTTPYLRSLVEYSEESEFHREDDSGKKDFSLNDSLKFEKVSFNYDENTPVLNDLSFRIQRGQMLGIIGPSGAGKTTIVDLLLRLFYPTNGQILLDGVPMQEISLASWRKNIGYVSQDIFLANDSIKNNIRFYDDSVTDEDIEKAAKMADIYDFVKGLPQGFETSTGERGVTLSGGQRQRIAIARALARKPQILILDEATSALDNESEVKIQEVIKNLKGKLTVIVIAHRLSTIESVDHLLAIQDGQILEEGKPEDLLKNKESYFHKVYNIRK
ncbi:ABC transporter ATP-binding protein [Candidatus Falkowbacteria bacterium]|nr:ABC transporter ATP-binding protein [Candidatus Falkowbacteria bacterium]